MNMKRIIAGLTLLVYSAMSAAAGFPFQPNQVLNAADLNSALQTAAITSGTIDSVTVTNSVIRTSIGTFTSLTSPSVSITGGLIDNVPIGTTTPAAGAFSTLASNGTVSGAGFTAYLASPPAIGGTAPNTGRFTTITATTSVSTPSATITGGTMDGVVVGSSVPAAGRFTTITATTSVSTPSATITGGTMDGVVVGSSVPAAGTFTNVAVTGGANHAGIYTPTYTDGTVVDYTAGNGRISVGVGDTLTLYASGVANTQIAKFGTTGTQLQGTTTNDNAAAGQVGEFVTSSVAFNSVNLTSNTAANITSISLTAGDWDVWGSVQFAPAATTSVTLVVSAVNSTSANIGTASVNCNQMAWAAMVPNQSIIYPAPVWRVSVATTTTVYLIGYATFSASTMTAGGTINARRVR